MSAWQFSILVVMIFFIHVTASLEKVKLTCPFRIVDMEPYLGLHTLPMGLPLRSMNRISISFSTASITASLVICAPLLIWMLLTAEAVIL